MDMIKKFIKVISTIVVTVIALGCVTVYADQSKPPVWFQNAIGMNSAGLSEEDATKQEALDKWREEKKNIKVPILLYHHITNDEFSMEDAISVISPTDFRLHMTAIKANFNPISLKQYCDYVMCDDGSITIPKNPIIVTFDDGYLSNYELGFPILKELSIPATIFVVTDTVGAVAGDGKVNYTHFTWEQAREMENSGLIDIQSHTLSHSKLDKITFQEQVLEIRKSKFDIEKNMGKVCDMIAYPYGNYDEGVKDIARSSGYKAQLLVDDRTTEDDYDVNVPTEGIENITRMTIAGNMGNVNVIEIIRKTINKKVIK